MNHDEGYQSTHAEVPHTRAALERELLELAAEVFSAHQLMARLTTGELAVIVAGLHAVDRSTAEGRQAHTLLGLARRELARREYCT